MTATLQRWRLSHQDLDVQGSGPVGTCPPALAGTDDHVDNRPPARADRDVAPAQSQCSQGTSATRSASTFGDHVAARRGR